MRSVLAYLLLLHELGVWAVVDYICAKDWRCQRRVDLLSVDVLELAVQNEVVSFSAQTNSRLLAQQDECEDIAILLTAGEEELVWINAVCDRATEEGYQMEDNWGLVWVAKQELSRNVEENGNGEEQANASHDNEPCWTRL